jgi:glycosyltransferase involved in cell wall biosynthesis
MIGATGRILMVRATDAGRSPHVQTLARFLAQQGFGVTVVCLEGEAGTTEEEGVEVVRLGYQLGGPALRKTFQVLAAARALRRLVSGRDFDILYVVDSWTLPVLRLALGSTFRSRGRRLVYHTYDWLEPSLVRRAHVRLERAICRQADLVVNTDRSRARLQRTLYGLPRTPLAVQNCALRETPLPPFDAACRARLLGGAEGRDKVLMIYPTTVAHESSAERQHFGLIQAFAQLPANYHLATFWAEGAEYRRCRRAIAEFGLERRVTFLDPMPFARLREHVASADVGAILYDDSWSSGYFLCNPDKLSLLMNCGVPFVASDFPNLEAITYRHGLGVCCDSRDPHALAGAIRELAEGAVLLAERKKHVRRVFEDELHFERQAGVLVQALDTLARPNLVKVG